MDGGKGKGQLFTRERVGRPEWLDGGEGVEV
jgi:hypothetical protein